MTTVSRIFGSVSAFWFILPCLLVLAFTSCYPVGFGLAISLTNWNWGNQLDFVGLANYANLLGDAEFWTVMTKGLIYLTRQPPALYPFHGSQGSPA